MTDEISSSYESAYISFNKVGSSDSRLNWFFTTGVEGTAYNRIIDLNSGDISFIPGFYYIPRPFFQARAATDGDRNAVSFGGKIVLRE